MKKYLLKGWFIGLLIGIVWSAISIYNSYITTSSEIAQYQVLIAPLKIILCVVVGIVVGIVYKEVKNKNEVIK